MDPLATKGGTENKKRGGERPPRPFSIVLVILQPGEEFAHVIPFSDQNEFVWRGRYNSACMPILRAMLDKFPPAAMLKFQAGRITNPSRIFPNPTARKRKERNNGAEH